MGHCKMCSQVVRRMGKGNYVKRASNALDEAACAVGLGPVACRLCVYTIIVQYTVTLNKLLK